MFILIKLSTELGEHCLPVSRAAPAPARAVHPFVGLPARVPVGQSVVLICRRRRAEKEERGEDTQQKQKSVKFGGGDLAARQAR